MCFLSYRSAGCFVESTALDSVPWFTQDTIGPLLSHVSELPFLCDRNFAFMWDRLIFGLRTERASDARLRGAGHAARQLPLLCLQEFIKARLLLHPSIVGMFDTMRRELGQLGRCCGGRAERHSKAAGTAGAPLQYARPARAPAARTALLRFQHCD